MESCLYEGWVRHCRYEPVVHEFRYRLFLIYLDLAEIGSVFRDRWFWSAEHPALAWFRRADYLGDPRQTLDEAVRDRVAAGGRPRPKGPIRLLTHLRYFGYVMNPVSLYYCFGNGGKLETIVAEVTNTPWGERFQYVLDGRDMERGSEQDKEAESAGARESIEAQIPKQFHVSPFMPMDVDYSWQFSLPGERLSAHVDSFRQGRHFFDATLQLQRRPLTGANLSRMLLRYPAMTARVFAGIYWQAARLWWKRCPFFSHPRHACEALDEKAQNKSMAASSNLDESKT